MMTWENLWVTSVYRDFFLRNTYSLLKKVLLYNNLFSPGSSLWAPVCLQTHLYREKTNEHIISKTNFLYFLQHTQTF